MKIEPSEAEGTHPVDREMIPNVIKVRSCKRFHRFSSCNKVVDMPVEVQRQEPMVSSNRSRENDCGSVTANPTRSQCCSEVTLNVKVTE